MNAISAAVSEIRNNLPQTELRFDEPMKNHTSFKIGGPVSVMVFPNSAESMTHCLDIFQKHGVSPLIIGNGTNLLCCDNKMELAVIKTSPGLCSMRIENGDTIRAGGGVPLSRLATFALENGLTGLEFAHGIPGSLGGAVYMNAGAYGGQIADVVKETEAWNGQVFSLLGAEHEFSYRHSAFAENSAVILSSVIKLTSGNKEEIHCVMNELSEKRKASQPLTLPSAGSTFKRPATGYAAAMIDEAGLKGYTVGGAQVSEKHAGFVVNTGGACFADVISVMDHVCETVYKKFGTTLEPEVKIIKC